jgi:hypothetical protein
VAVLGDEEGKKVARRTPMEELDIISRSARRRWTTNEFARNEAN